MHWPLPLAALVFLASPETAIAEVCLEGSGELWSNGMFDWCRTSGEIRKVVGGDYSTMTLTPNPVLGGNSQTGPIARYEIAMRSDAGSAPSEDRLALLNTALTDRVCRSYDLGNFVTAGGRVVFDLFVVSQAQENSLDMGLGTRRLVSSTTVATCEAN